jgi:hypothetical protein
MPLPAGVTDSATYQQFGGAITLSKMLTAASSTAICLSQIPAANTPLLLNGTTGGALDTGRRVIVTAGSEAAQQTLVITGLSSQGAPISETLTIPSGTTGVYPSARDYLVVTSIVSPTAFTAAITVGTSATGSTQWYLPAHYQAEFSIGCSLTVPAGGTASVECTRDIPYAIPEIYQPGMSFNPPICDAFPWPTLNNVGPGESIGDIDSPVTGVRLTISAGTGRVTLRMTPIGLRT